jgi:leucyl/phenylalanyl-tRNA---protein transferase
MPEPIDPDLLLRAYAQGVFPMADDRDAPEIYWVEPKRRGVLPLDGFHLSRSLAKTLKSERFVTTWNQAFEQVVQCCAAEAADRPSTWINAQIEDVVRILHGMGHSHSIETWRDGELVGGLYGISLGRAFFGESMFSRATDASKVALAHLVARLRAGGFTLLDCQFQTPHLATLGVIEISRKTYWSMLSSATSSSTAAGSGASSTGADLGALDRLRRGSEDPPPPLLYEPPSSPSSPPRTTIVSLPVSGYFIWQSLTQTSQMGFSTTLSEGDSL